jgi:hypothetical protein
MSAAAASSFRAGPAPTFHQWLAGLVDLTHAPSALHLKFLSEFNALAYKSESDITQYARTWAALGDFLWTHRKLPFKSSVQMHFWIDEMQLSTEAYWVKVAQSAELAARQVVTSLQAMLNLHAGPGAAAAKLRLIPEKGMVVYRQSARDAVGLCHNALWNAYERCIFLPALCPLLRAQLQVHHLQLRILSCLIFGGHFARDVGEGQRKAGMYFATAQLLGRGQQSPEIQCAVKCCEVLRLWGATLSALTNKRNGAARAFYDELVKLLGDQDAVVVGLKHKMPETSVVQSLPVGPSVSVANPERGDEELFMKGSLPFTGAEFHLDQKLLPATHTPA